MTTEDSKKKEIFEMSPEGWQAGQVAGDLEEEEKLFGKNSSDIFCVPGHVVCLGTLVGSVKWEMTLLGRENYGKPCYKK